MENRFGAAMSGGRSRQKKKRLLKKKRKTQQCQRQATINHIPEVLPNLGAAASQWARSYRDILTWQFEHQIAYWKSKAVALSYENKVLHNIIADLYKNKRSVGHHSNLQHNLVHRIPQADAIESDAEESEPCEYEISEEMLAFLQKSAEHRQKRDNEKREKKGKQQKAAPPKFAVGSEHTAELKVLYGDLADKIGNLETAVGLNFDRYIDSHDPIYWPNIPLKL